MGGTDFRFVRRGIGSPLIFYNTLRFVAKVRGEVQQAEAETRWDLAEKVLAGDLTLEEIPAEIGGYTAFEIEDYVTQVGQGPIAGRGREHLGFNDIKVNLIRRLWLNEVSALIEGRPLTEWKIPAEPYAVAPQ